MRGAEWSLQRVPQSDGAQAFASTPTPTRLHTRLLAHWALCQAWPGVSGPTPACLGAL